MAKSWVQDSAHSSPVARPGSGPQLYFRFPAAVLPQMGSHGRRAGIATQTGSLRSVASAVAAGFFSRGGPCRALGFPSRDVA